MSRCLLYQREKDVPCQFLNIELPGCIWFLEYNFISIFTCLKKDTNVLDVWLPSWGAANLPDPLLFYLAKRRIVCTRGQKEEDNHDSHQGAGLSPSWFISFYIKGFGSPRKTCLSTSPSPCAPQQWHPGTWTLWKSQMVQEPQVGHANLELLGGWGQHLTVMLFPATESTGLHLFFFLR